MANKNCLQILIQVCWQQGMFITTIFFFSTTAQLSFDLHHQSLPSSRIRYHLKVIPHVHSIRILLEHIIQSSYSRSFALIHSYHQDFLIHTLIILRSR